MENPVFKTYAMQPLSGAIDFTEGKERNTNMPLMKIHKESKAKHESVCIVLISLNSFILTVMNWELRENQVLLLINNHKSLSLLWRLLCSFLVSDK